MTTPGIKLADLDTDLRGLARQSQQLVDQAQAATPPGPLRPINQHVIEALQFRVSGLTGLAEAFAREGTAKSTAGAGARLASQADRLVASDVVWDDLFKTPTQQELERQGVSGVAVPDSNLRAEPPTWRAGARWR